MLKKVIFFLCLSHSAIHAMELQKTCYQPRTLKESCFKKYFDLSVELPARKLPEDLYEDFMNFKIEETDRINGRIRKRVEEKLEMFEKSKGIYLLEKILDEFSQHKQYKEMEYFIDQVCWRDSHNADLVRKESLSKCLDALKMGDIGTAKLYQENAYNSSDLPIQVLNASGIDLAHRRLIIKDWVQKQKVKSQFWFDIYHEGHLREEVIASGDPQIRKLFKEVFSVKIGLQDIFESILHFGGPYAKFFIIRSYVNEILRLAHLNFRV